jgi:hypothetical protein
MFPAGAVVGALLAARHQARPTKALVIGERFVLQAEAKPIFLTAMLLGVVSVLALSIARHRSDDISIAANVLLWGLACILVSLFAFVWSHHFLFDDESIEERACWHRPRRLNYRDISSVRLARGLGRVVIRSSTGTALGIPLHYRGTATFSKRLLERLPPNVALSKPAGAELARMAAAA